MLKTDTPCPSQVLRLVWETDMEIYNYHVISVMILTYSNCYGSKEEEVPNSEGGGE